jgi:hypothetical protein
VSTAQSRGCGFDSRRALLEAVFAEKALTVLMRTIGADEATQNRSFALLGVAGTLLDRAPAAGAVRRGVTIEEMLLIVNAVGRRVQRQRRRHRPSSRSHLRRGAASRRRVLTCVDDRR